MFSINIRRRRLRRKWLGNSLETSSKSHLICLLFYPGELGIRDASEKGYIRIEDKRTAMPKADRPDKPPPFIEDEPGSQERFQRGLERALKAPPKPQKPMGRKPKERPASKGRVHKGKTGR